MTERCYDAWWLPGWQPNPSTTWWELRGQGVLVRAPRLSQGEVQAIMERLRYNRVAALQHMPIDNIMRTIGAAIGRWLDPFSAELHQACSLIPAFTGYPEAAVRKGLATLLPSFRDEQLRRLLVEELGDPEVLDGFRPRRGAPGLTCASGPALIAHNFAGNIPGLPAQSLVAATLAKAASLGKVAAEEPVFAPLFIRSIAAIDPQLAGCMAVTYWPGEPVDDAALAVWRCADAVIAYGSDRAIAGLQQLVPRSTPFVAYGHKLSFAVIAADSVEPSSVKQTARRAAYDVCRYDQQGCLSPHVLYVEAQEHAAVDRFAQELAAELERWSALVPRSSLSPEEQSTLRRLREQQHFRAAQGLATVLGSDSDAWTVLVDSDPTFRASCLNRTIWVLPVSRLEDVPDLLAPVRAYVQTAGVAASHERLMAIATMLASAGIDRVCPIGQMGDAPATWHHDGRFHVLDLLRFTDVEPEATVGRWEFSHPDGGVLGSARGAAPAAKEAT